MQNHHYRGVGTRTRNALWATIIAASPILSLELTAESRAQQTDKLVATGLSYSPRQSGIQYDKVQASDESRCTGRYETRNGSDGLMIYSPDGQLLRRFADTNGDRNVDEWCYFKDGVEVYRDIDSDYNGVADQYRWLGTAGIRWGIDKNEDGKIDSWKAISAEEVTIEVVESIRNQDRERFERLLLSESELENLQLGEEKAQQLTERLEKARKNFSEWTRSQKTIVNSTKWAHFAADKPGVIPAGTEGSAQDVVAYENVVALIDNDATTQQLLVGTLIQSGTSWKMTDLPRIVNDGAVLSEAGFFFPSVAVNRTGSGSTTEGGLSPAMQTLLTELDRVDSALRDGKGDPEQLNAERTTVMMRLIQATRGTEDMGSWIRQFADSVSSAAQTGTYPEGLEKLKELEETLPKLPGGEEQQAYVAFRVISTENIVQMSSPKANIALIQDQYIQNLEKFAEKYPESPEAAEAMIQIGVNYELNRDEAEAQKWYRKIATNFSNTSTGKKAQGAIARLNLEGKTLNLRGKTLDGKDFQTAGPTIVHYWATWCDPCKNDMIELRKIQAKYAKQNLQVVGVNLDNDAKGAAAFLKDNAGKFPWPHIHEQGGFESDLAVKLGVLSLPVTILIDQKGIVVKRSAHFKDDMVEAVEKLMETGGRPNPSGRPQTPAQARGGNNKTSK
jgi:thiol-disulfide isomerase/thioredoxin